MEQVGDRVEYFNFDGYPNIVYLISSIQNKKKKQNISHISKQIGYLFGVHLYFFLCNPSPLTI